MATEKTIKPANYTEEQSTKLATAYKAATDEASRAAVVESFAKEFGKATRSIVAKLVSLKIYQKAGYVRKDGKPAEKKNETADALGKVLGLSAEDTDSLTKANRKALQAVFAAIANSRPVEALTPEQQAEKSAKVSAITQALSFTNDEEASFSQAGAEGVAAVFDFLKNSGEIDDETPYK